MVAARGEAGGRQENVKRWDEASLVPALVCFPRKEKLTCSGTMTTITLIKITIIQ